jgi:hypothetical protein
MQQQMAATVEEQMMVKAIREECPWETLPKRIQAAVVTKEECTAGTTQRDQSILNVRWVPLRSHSYQEMSFFGYLPDVLLLCEINEMAGS